VTKREATGWRRWLPGLGVAREYELAWLPRDLMAGLVLATMLVPAGIAYAQAAGLPGINGLYATITCLLAYAVFGPSRIMVLGPDSSLAALIFAAVSPLAVAVMSGMVCVLFGVFRLGFVTELISKPIRYGYMNGIALVVLISQLPKMLGISIERADPLRDVWQIGREVMAGHAELRTLALGAGTLLLILVLKPFRRVPGILIAVVGATLAVVWLGLEEHGVKVLGSLPHGLPTFAWPRASLQDLNAMVAGAFAVALVSFADTSVLSRTYALKSGTPVNPNQELIGLGAANLASGLIKGFPISSSSSRTPVAEASGAKSQLTGVVGALAVAALVAFAPHLLKDMPIAALGAVVIASAIGLFELTDLRRILRMQRWEFWLSVGCAAGVVIFGTIPGIGLAIIAAVIEFLWDGWRPHSAVLGRVDGVRGYHDVTRYPDARLVPGLVILRWDAPLFFANAEQFRERVLDAVGHAPKPVRQIVIAAEPVTSIDVTSADMLDELDRTLEETKIELDFAEMKDPVKDKLKRFGLFERLGPENFHPTVSAAVDDYLTKYKVNWKP
jgi:high affinity sulfate transporter 1